MEENFWRMIVVQLQAVMPPYGGLNLEDAVESFCTALRRRQIEGSLPTAKKTVEILRLLLTTRRHADGQQIIDEIRSWGTAMQTAKPSGACFFPGVGLGLLPKLQSSLNAVLGSSWKLTQVQITLLAATEGRPLRSGGSIVCSSTSYVLQQEISNAEAVHLWERDL